MKVIVEDYIGKGKWFNLNCNSCEGLYPNSMDVRFSKSCDNQCLFCIEKEGIKSAKFNIPKMIETTKSSGRSEILILGGEPFLFVDYLLEYIEGIRPYVNHIYHMRRKTPCFSYGDIRRFFIFE